MDKNIELELRAEIPKNEFGRVFHKLESIGKLISKTKRLSVMYFGKIGKNSFDIRIRITNGQAEIVIKRGDLHAHDRVEVGQKIDPGQFMGMVKIINQLGFSAEVGERYTSNFDLGKQITASLVKAGNIAYLEIEKMTAKSNKNDEYKNIEKVMKRLGIKPLADRAEFDDLCLQLSRNIDWRFRGSEDDYRRLKRLFDKHPENLEE